jgi:predicted ATP-grasp superfamily ATP-dependent carboligase
VITRGEHHVALAAVRSLGRKNIETMVISEFENALTFYSKYCSNTIVSEKSSNFFQRFSKNDMILPTDENQMIELAKNKNKYNCILAFPEYTVLELTLNKKLLLERGIELGIPCPNTICVPDFDSFRDKLDQIKFPAVVKPVRSYGGVGISFVDSKAGLEEILDESLQKFGPLLIQEKIPYLERYSVAVLMNKDHVLKNCCVLKAMRSYPINAGPATVVESVNRPDLVNLGTTLLQSIKYSGIAEIEFVIDQRDKTPKLMEVNPRLWGSLQGAINAGVDFPFLLYKLYNDGDVDKNLKYKKGVRTRNVIGNDHRQIAAIIRGKYPVSIKIDSIIEFIKFYQDDGYYVFDLYDMKPFVFYFIDSTRRIIKRALHRYGS